MLFKVGDKVIHRSNETKMVVTDILSESTNSLILNAAQYQGYKINDYICSWIFENKKECAFFREDELSRQ